MHSRVRITALRVRIIAPPALLCDVRHELALIEVATAGLLRVVRALVRAVVRPLVRARRVERPATHTGSACEDL